MVRLGLRLAMRSGREGLVRFVLTASAVGIGVAVLLVVLAYFHAYQRPRTALLGSFGGPRSASSPRLPRASSGTTAKLQRAASERLDVAALESGAPWHAGHCPAARRRSCCPSPPWPPC